MIRTIWTLLIDKIAGQTGRAAQLDRDDRRSIPGWPIGLDLGAPPLEMASKGVSDRAQHALPLYWDGSSAPEMRRGRRLPFAVIDGGLRHTPSART